MPSKSQTYSCAKQVVTVSLYCFHLSSPPDPHQEDYKYFLSDDEKQNLALIGSVPRNGIEQVRIHWLLDTVTVM